MLNSLTRTLKYYGSYFPNKQLNAMQECYPDTLLLVGLLFDLCSLLPDKNDNSNPYSDHWSGEPC